MAHGRDTTVVLALVLLCGVLHGELAESMKYTVGDSRGWTFGSGSWSNGKRFLAGDMLGECSGRSNYGMVFACPKPKGKRTLGSGSAILFC
jgi:hypothetical protein